MSDLSEDLLEQIGTILGQTLDEDYASGAAVNDLYEAYVWSRVIDVADGMLWTVTYADRNGPVADDLYLRRGPGVIYSPTPFTHAVLTSVGRPTLEVHLGILVQGRSGVAHEFDVVVLSQAAADQARATNTNPEWSDVVFQAECKFYSGALTLGLGRNLRGLSADCRLRMTGGLVSNATETESLTHLLRHHGTYYRPGLTPSSAGAVARLDGDIRKRLRRWLFANPRARSRSPIEV